MTDLTNFNKTSSSMKRFKIIYKRKAPYSRVVFRLTRIYIRMSHKVEKYRNYIYHFGFWIIIIFLEYINDNIL